MRTDLHDINDELLVKFLLGEASPEEGVSINQWLAASADNQKYFDHFKLIWDTSKEIAAKSTVDENAAWMRFQQRTTEAKAQQIQTPVIPIRQNFSWMRVAAAVLIVALGIATYFIWQGNKPATQINIAATNNAVTDTLPDGSSVTLNKNTTLSYADNFKGKSRAIKLNGEAYFKVAQDKDKPFVVNVNDVTVTVLGTSFNIKSINGKTEVIVESGLVRVEHAGKAIELKPNEKALIAQQDTALQMEQTNDKLYNYYSTKEFNCDRTPLWKLVEVLNQAYNAHIVIENPSIKSLPLTTTFNDQPLDKVLSVIAETLGIIVEKNGETIILK